METTEQKALEAQMAQTQKMNAVGTLAGGIAHDFNNVLTAIIMASDLLLTSHRPSDPSFPDIMNIKQNANRAANLVRQLLAFSRRQTLWEIILPQCVKRMLPPWMNLYAILTMATVLASIVGVSEMLTQTGLLTPEEGQAIEQALREIEEAPAPEPRTARRAAARSGVCFFLASCL